ncbi:hypothetical protein ABH931_005535 [Streptacidiphilus sp. MAP12-33]|uniref:hypothetical protein n=1 Tax=Streptacidiphilus sp. MAP12-33 TaxID=3156266 RepID=UPI0035195214
MTVRAARAATLALTAALAGACAAPEADVSGTVIDRYPWHNPATHSEELRLTIRLADGSTMSFRVYDPTYGKCFRGSHYPACKNR